MQNLTTSLAHGITLIDAYYIQNGIASIYIIAQGEKVAIIETGTVHSVSYVIATLKTLGFTLDDVDYVIPTHIHLDHAAGAGELLALCPQAQLVVHPRGAPHMIDPSKLEAGTMAVYGEKKYRQLYGSLKPIDEQRVIIAADGFVLDFNGRILRFIDTPGHALHHFCIYDQQSEGIFTGDSFGIAYKELATATDEFIFATTTPVHFDPAAMLTTIDKLLSFNPKYLYLTHFGMIKPSDAVVAQLIQSINAFVTIAEAEKESIEGRVGRIEQRIMQWLLDQLTKTECALSLEECKKLLATDCNLNAQGLDVWLKRVNKYKFQSH
jgi:glyoxylase-like metal-dependent hydrolase (beta-lactamase superfamily II)